jgi:hypothetical protein
LIEGGVNIIRSIISGGGGGILWKKLL